MTQDEHTGNTQAPAASPVDASIPLPNIAAAKPSPRHPAFLTAILAMVSLLSAWYVAQLFGPAPALGVSVLAALLPLMLVLIAAHRVDMYLTRPLPELLVVCGAGATAGFAAALLISVLTAGSLPEGVNAGVVEEIVKLIVTVTLAVRLAPVRTPAQGATLAMLVAGGVAFTENIAYFVIAAASGELTSVFVQRGVFSPLAHASFAVCFGLGLGVRHWGRRIVAVGVGLFGAMALHSIWNTLALAGNPAILILPPLQLVQVFALIEMEHRRVRRLAPLLDAALAGTAPFTAPELDLSTRALITDLRARARRRRLLPRHVTKEFDAWCRCWASLTPDIPVEKLNEITSKAVLYRRAWDNTFIFLSTTSRTGSVTENDTALSEPHPASAPAPWISPSDDHMGNVDTGDDGVRENETGDYGTRDNDTGVECVDADPAAGEATRRTGGHSGLAAPDLGTAVTDHDPDATESRPL